MGGSSDSWDEAGVGFRLEELECAYPVDDELDADDEDQEAHNSCDRADAGSSELVDPGCSVAQKHRDGGGRDQDAQDNSDLKTDGGVAGGQRDDDADRAGSCNEGERHGGERHILLECRVLVLLIGGAALVLQHRETRVCDDEAAGDLQGGQVESEEAHDERAADCKGCQDCEHVDTGLPRLRANCSRGVTGGEASESGESADRVGDWRECQDRR